MCGKELLDQRRLACAAWTGKHYGPEAFTLGDWCHIESRSRIESGLEKTFLGNAKSEHLECGAHRQTIVTARPNRNELEQFVAVTVNAKRANRETPAAGLAGAANAVPARSFLTLL
jgi:hypothetical protein